MAENSFDIIDDKDKRHMAYALCVLGTAGVGATFGSIAGGQTLLGFIGGGVAGLFMCRWVDEPLKQKLFSSRKMTEGEFLALARQTKRQYPHLSRDQVLDLLAASRREALRTPSRYRS